MKLKSRGITLLTKACIVKVTIFPVVVYRCQSWIIKKGEHKRIDAFKLCCYRRLFRVLWTGRRSNQSILRKSFLNIDWKNWYWSSNSLATWCKEPIRWQEPWYWERLEGKRKKGWQRMRWSKQHHWLNGQEFVQTPSAAVMGLQRAGHDLVIEQQQQHISLGENVYLYSIIF